MSPEELRRHVIYPLLEELDPSWSIASMELLLGTAIAESGLRALKQRGGPALGLWQMEPATHDDIVHNYLDYRGELRNKVLFATASIGFNSDYLVFNLRYACAFARIHYMRVPEPLPRENDIEGQARYWKKYYNTEAGKGTVKHYLKEWERCYG